MVIPTFSIQVNLSYPLLPINIPRYLPKVGPDPCDNDQFPIILNNEEPFHVKGFQR